MRKKHISIYIITLIFLLIFIQNSDFKEFKPNQPNQTIENVKSSEFYGVDTSGFASDVFIEGNYAYVADYGSGLQIIDISDISNPVIVKNIPAEAGSWVEGVVVEGNYAYCADFTGGLKVINVTDPANAEEVALCSIGSSYVEDVYVKGNYAYLASFGMMSTGSIYVVMNITDPTNPIKLSTPIMDGSSWDITGEGNYVYFSGDSFYSDDNYVYILNITDGGAGSIVGSVTTPGGGAGDLCVHGDYLYFANGNNGIQVIDISDKTNPVIVGNLTTPGFKEDIYVDGNYAYIASRDSTAGTGIIGSALEILNVTNPRSPELIYSINGTESTSESPGYYAIKIENDYGFLADRYNGLKIFRTGCYNSVQNLTRLDLGDTTDVEISGDKLFVNADGWKLVNITNATVPTLVGSVDSPPIIEYRGDYKYTAEMLNLTIYNMTGTPTKIKEMEVNAIFVSVKGDFAYVTTEETAFSYNLVVYNISDPINPINVKEVAFEINEFPNGGKSEIKGNYLYVTTGGTGLYVVDISNPLDPIVLDNFIANKPFGAGAYPMKDVAISGDFAYVVGEFGLYMLKIFNHYIGDSDEDGIDAFEEVNIHNTNPFSNDTDIDGLLDGDEINLYNTNPMNADTDMDLMPDKWELDNFLDPNFFDDGDYDYDVDGLENKYEYLNGTKMDDPDSDDDGINDGNEVNSYGTNPLSSDSDNDLMPDLWEIQSNTLPNTADADMDPDNDGLTNYNEFNHGTNPKLPDTDGDGLLDGAEINIHHTNATNTDTDGDSYSDKEEVDAGSDPNLASSIPRSNNSLYIVIGAIVGVSGLVVLKQKTKKKAPLNIFLSHAMLDFEKFNLLKTASILEKHSAVDKVFYCERDTTLNIDDWMEKTVPLSQILFYYVSSNSLESKDCDRELELARINKIPIVPILAQGFSWDILKTKNLNREIGFEYKSHNFNKFKEEIIDYIDKIKKTLDDLLNVLEKNQISNIEIVEKELNLPVENIQDFTDTLCKIGYISGVWNSDKTEFWNKKEVLHKMKSTNNFNNEKDLDNIIKRAKIHPDSKNFFKKIINWKEN